MLRSETKAYVVLGLALCFAAVPFFVPFNGFDPTAYPIPQDDPPAQPAGYAFSIWGLIYVGLIVSAIFGAWKRRSDPEWDKSRLPLGISLAIGAVWLPVAEASPIAATVLIWGMLIFALVALVRTPLKDRWFLRAPVALYTGWLVAASCVSIALTGAGYGLFFSESTWAFVAVTMATLITLAVLLNVRQVPELALAAIWALLAICLKNSHSAPAVAMLAGLASMAIALALIAVATTSVCSDKTRAR